jgi:hypothetical protein
VLVLFFIYDDDEKRINKYQDFELVETPNRYKLINLDSIININEAISLQNDKVSTVKTKGIQSIPKCSNLNLNLNASSKQISF